MSSDSPLSKSPIGNGGKIRNIQDFFDPLNIGPLDQNGKQKNSPSTVLDPFNITGRQNNGQSFTSKLSEAGDPNYRPPKDPTDPPSVENARLTAFDSMAQSLRRRRAMSTLLTGGMGVLDSPSTSQTNLIGG